jgi:hypothetical protein
MAQEPIKNIFQGKTPAQIARIREEDRQKAAKQIAARELEKKKTTPVPVQKGSQVEKAMKHAASPKNSEGRTAAQERDYMKAMEENAKEVKRIDEGLKAGRLAEAAKRAGIKTKK